MAERGLTTDAILTIRSRHLSDLCQFHYMESPLKIVRSKGQYFYNEYDEEFLDCSSRTSAVGHCHPDVVEAASKQIAKLSVPYSGMQDEYSRQLLSTLPSSFEVCLFTNSGGEANDLALCLAQRYTGRTGVAVVDGAFHGSAVSLTDISPLAFRGSPEGKKPWVHVIPCPNLNLCDENNSQDAANKYVSDAIKILDNAKKHEGDIACFICEPVMVVPGVIVPPQGWLKKMYDAVHDRGGLIISDEIVVGLGRTGSHFWGFQAMGDGAVPDIVTVGKPLGNGYPMAAVLTSSKIVSVLTEAEQLAYYRCGPVEAVVGLKVLRILKEEGLVSNALDVGTHLKRRLEDLKFRHRNIGGVRGYGLIVGVELVRDEHIPATDLAERLSYKLKDRKVLVAPEGDHKNVLTILPPYCITREDVDYIIQVFEEVLFEIEMDQNIYSFIRGNDNRDVPQIPWFQYQDSSPTSSSIASLDYQSLD